MVEKSGILWAYLGEGEPPAFPELDCFVAPGTHTFAFKGHMACNWLQALEVGIDPAHASYLHRFFEDEDTSTAYGKQFRGASAGTDLPMTKILREYDRPIINVEHTEYGLRLIALREIDEERTHVRVTNQLFPHGFVIPMSTEMTITQWHVPVDDENCYWYAIFTSYTNPVDKQKMRDQRLELYELPDYKSRKNSATITASIRTSRRPRPIPAWAPTSTCTTSGRWNRWARSRTAPRSISARATRRSCNIAACCGRRSRRSAAARSRCCFSTRRTARSIQGPATMDGIGPTQGWEIYWMEVDVKRRRGAPWAAPVPKEIAGQRAPADGGGVTVISGSPSPPSLRAQAKQSRLRRGRSLDCFAVARMTGCAHASRAMHGLRSNRVTFVARHALWSDEQKDAAARLRRIVEEKNLEVIRLAFPDQHGILRGKTLIAAEAIASLESGCSITTTMLAKDTSHRTVFPVFTSGGGFGMKEMEGAADVLMVADPTTFRVLPWAPATGWVLCDLYFGDGRPVPFATAALYRKVLDELGEPRPRFRRRPRGRIPHLQARRRADARRRMPASPARRRR